MTKGLTLVDKVWRRNLVKDETVAEPALLYVSLHLLHEITAPQAFAFLAERGLRLRRPDLTVAMVDHCAPTGKDRHGAYAFKDAETARQIAALEAYCQEYGVACLTLGHRFQGIVHAVAPELGLSRPGQVIVCGDSHTSTHGAFGALAFGIGSSEVAEVLATQCMLQRKPKNMRVLIDRPLPPGVTAKDLALAVVKHLGANGGKGFAIEYQGAGVRALAMEERLTLCNMTIEAGARSGLIAPDATTRSYLRNTALGLDAAADDDLFSDQDAVWDATVAIDTRELRPMMTWGTNPAMAMPLGGSLPMPRSPAEEAARRYMGWSDDGMVEGRSVDLVFIGSCTNGRMSDLRAAAQLLQGQRIAPHTRCLIVPASKLIKEQAEREGLDRIFTSAGAVWGEPSCSLCNGMNGDIVPPGQLSVSTSNRNFEGRQGPQARTILVSPASAAQIAIRGTL